MNWPRQENNEFEGLLKKTRAPGAGTWANAWARRIEMYWRVLSAAFHAPPDEDPCIWNVQDFPELRILDGRRWWEGPRDGFEWSVIIRLLDEIETDLRACAEGRSFRASYNPFGKLN